MTPFFIPERETHGGSPVGNSFSALFANCPRKWYNTFLRPVRWVDEQGNLQEARGIKPLTTKLPFLSGSVFHEGLASWYRSGCRDGEDTGEYSLDRALETAEAHWISRKSEYQNTEVADEDWKTTREMLVNYHARFGPESNNPDYPDLRVLCDETGEPLVEREFRLELGYRDYVFTTRVDLVVSHRGFVKVMEHKTSAASWVRRRLSSSHWDSQMTGEIWTLNRLFPDQPLNGVLINVAVKNRTSKSSFDIAERETTTRTQAQLDAWHLGTLDLLKEIQQRVEAFEEGLAAGRDLEYLGQWLFPDHGTRTGYCTAYNDLCEYADLCKRPERESKSLGAFKARTHEENRKLKEWTG